MLSKFKRANTIFGKTGVFDLQVMHLYFALNQLSSIILESIFLLFKVF